MASALDAEVTPSLSVVSPLQVPVTFTRELSFTTQTASYTLNCDKLIGNLVKDAKSGEPSVTLLPLKNEEGCVQLKCSPAFINAIALPSLLTIGSPSGSPYTRLVKGLLVTQPNIPVQHHDAAGLIDHHLVQFDISSNSNPPSVIGHLSVHIYHGTRLVQVQCTKRVPDGRTVAVWFSDEILCPLFQARAKAINFDYAAINHIHQGIISAFSGAGCKSSNSNSSSLKPGAGSCFTCKGKFTKVATPINCGECHQPFHKQRKCSNHNCLPTLELTSPEAPPAGPGDSNTILTKSGDTDARPGRKRSALNTTGFRQSSSRDVRARELIDSCDDIEVFSPLPLPLPPPTTEGQSQLRDALAAQALPPVQSSALTFISLPSQSEVSVPESTPAADTQITQKPKRKGLKKPNGPASTPEEIEIELLKRQLVAANIRITSTENALKESKESYSILVTRLNFFEQRENNANFSSAQVPQPAGAPPTCAAPVLLTEVSNMKCMLEDLQSSVSILLRAAPHPLPPYLPAASAHVQAQALPPAVHTFLPSAPREDFSIPPPPIAASYSQMPPVPEEPAAVPSTATTSSSLQSHEVAGQLQPPLIPTPPSTELNQVDLSMEDSCPFHLPPTSVCNAAQSQVHQPTSASSTSIPPARAPAPRSRQTSRPPTWAAVTARRIPPLFPIPVWQPGYVPTVSASHPSPRPPVVWVSGSAPNSSTLTPHSSAPPSRPQPGYQRQPRVNSSRSRTTPRGTSGQGRSRPTGPPSQPTQELLIDLN